MANRKNKSADERRSPVPGIPASVMNHINFVADKMIGTCDLHACDRDDLVQELSIIVLRAIDESRKTQDTPLAVRYLNTAVDHSATEIYRRRIIRGLDIPKKPLESCLNTRHEPIGDDAETNIRRRDVRDIVSTMPENLRTICDLIMRGYSFASIARALHVSPSSIRMRRIPQIRRFFVENGIKSEFF